MAFAFLTGLCITGYIALQSSRVQTFLTRGLVKKLSERIDTNISVGKVNIALFKTVVLKDILIEDQKNDTLFYTETIYAAIDSIRFRKKLIALNRLSFRNSHINIERDSSNNFNFQFIIDSLKTPRKQPGEWNYLVDRFIFNKSDILYFDRFKNGDQTLNIDDVNFNISNIKYLNDSLSWKIDQLTLNKGNEFVINQLTSDFLFTDRKIELSDFELRTSRSEINESKFAFTLPVKDTTGQQPFHIDLIFSDSEIDLYDLSLLLPSIKGMDQHVHFSGQIFGSEDDLKGKNLTLTTGENTSAVLDFYANGVSDPSSMYLFLDLKRSQTSFHDLAKIKMPTKNGVKYLQFPEAFYETGIITYKGNFTGFSRDFVAFGTLTSEMGKLTTDLSVVPDEKGRTLYRGEVATEDFNLGELFKIDALGKITFDGSVDGMFNRANRTVAGAFEGDIHRIDVNSYNYENIRFDGILDNKMFDGLVMVDDPNLEFDFLGQLNFNPEVPVFDFRLDLKKALPGELNLGSHYPGAEIAFAMNAKFSGDKIDNLAGSIMVENGFYKNDNGDLNLKGLELRSITGGPVKYLSFTSDFFDVEINGNYYFQNIANSIRKSLNHYIPAISYEMLAEVKENKFGYQLDVKNLDDVLKVFYPELKVETPFLLYGMVDSENSFFELKGSIPGISTENVMVRNIFIGNNPNENRYSSRFRFGEILLRNGMRLQNLTVDSKISDNIIDNYIAWGDTIDRSYQGEIVTQAVFSKNENSQYPHIDLQWSPATIYIADSVWKINPFTATVDSSTINIQNFNFSSGSQNLNINGKIGKDLSNILSLRMNNIDLGLFGIYMNKDLPLGGILNGSAGLVDFYGKRILFSNLDIDKFRFKDREIGNITLVNQWDNDESTLNTEIRAVSGNRQTMFANGYYNPSKNELLYNAEFDNFSLVALETLIRKNFSNFHGDASGKLKVYGSPSKILMDGTVQGSNAGLTVDYVKVSYYFTDSVRFSGDTIHFNNINFKDIAGNRGIFNGTIVHDNFHNMIYNLSVSSNKITAINTSAGNNPQFYGKVIASGRLNITGRGKRVNLAGSGTTLQGTNVNINLENESEIARYDFIQFVSTEDPVKQEFLFSNKNEKDFNLNLTIRATPEARVQLIYNSQIGDVIKAQGEGLLVFGMDKDNNITLSGTYALERGDYLFTLQNVINKRFTIQQGGTINWSGDPYNANINIKAVYKLKASLYDLLVNTYDNIYQSQRIPVECTIMLSDELSNPVIDFAIDFPSVEDRLIDEIRQFFNTPEEMNKQILSLVVLGKFYTPEYLRGTYEAQTPNLIGTTASELFSNQLSNWLSQISNNVDIGLNYRPGNQITNDEIELALSTQMFNDRVTINGNIGNNNNPNSTNNSELVGDFEINVKLNPSGKIKLKAYNRSNNNLIYETAPYTQGVGFSLTEEFNHLKNILDKIKNNLSKKKE
ncbi:MAG: translocation/assembly module TamB domain-containing protein [Prolixibacteraceae bacterium]|nr:translocation/assembly module TamB domain-containing protein [Prolixibacteraceae bacterium]